MALNPKYIVTSDVDTYFVNKDTGLPLSNGILTFYRDSQRTVKKDIFQLTGAPPNYNYTALPNPLTLSAVGTVQNAGGDNVVIYYYPYTTDPGTGLEEVDLYYVVCTDENGTEQFTREAWPNIGGVIPSEDEADSKKNQLANPSFTNVFINDDLPTILSVGGPSVFSIAPDWGIVASGSGTVTVQRIAVSGTDNIITSPPYLLDISVSVGVTSCYLRQRFNANSGLWSSTADQTLYLSGAFVARNQGGGNATVEMFYQDASSTIPTLIASNTFSGVYTRVSDSTGVAMPVSTDTKSGEEGYVDIYLTIQESAHVRLTSIQLVSTISEPLQPNMVPYDLDSSNRREAYQGDWYIPRAAAKQINSFLVGWDFSTNPYQFGSSGSITSTPTYIADQTIAASEAATGGTWSRLTNTSGLSITPTTNNSAIYLMQYLSGAAVKDMIGSKMASNIFAYVDSTSAGNGIQRMRIYLFRGGSAATFPSLPTTIGTLSSDGTFNLTAANWTEISRGGLGIPNTAVNNTITSVSEINDGRFDYGFSGWEITDATQINDTDKFAMVVTFSFANVSSQGPFIFRSISLVPGELPCRPAYKTPDEVLRECQYYFSKSFPSFVNAAANVSQGAYYSNQSAAGDIDNVLFYHVVLPVPMRTVPAVTLLNPFAVNALIHDVDAAADWQTSTVPAPRLFNNAFSIEGKTPVGSAIGNKSAVQWVANCRLGNV